MSERGDIAALIAPLADADPLTVSVMVTSADGRATVDGRVGELTGKSDQQVLLGVREMAAVVVVGGSTVRNEGYDRLLDDDARARRRARGLPAEPEFLVVTKSSDGLPANAKAVTAPETADGLPDMVPVWAAIRERHPDGLIVCEGGPSVLTRLVQQRLLDQLVLCISPKLVGGDGKRLTETGGSDAGFPVGLRVIAVTNAENFLFVRYGLTP
jgi:riboflavin biosynthesis pyrimidine reductase